MVTFRTLGMGMAIAIVRVAAVHTVHMGTGTRINSQKKKVIAVYSHIFVTSNWNMRGNVRSIPYHA